MKKIHLFRLEQTINNLFKIIDKTEYKRFKSRYTCESQNVGTTRRNNK